VRRKAGCVEVNHASASDRDQYNWYRVDATCQGTARFRLEPPADAPRTCLVKKVVPSKLPRQLLEPQGGGACVAQDGSPKRLFLAPYARPECVETAVLARVSRNERWQDEEQETAAHR
jgi:hypothetical protein